MEKDKKNVKQNENDKRKWYSVIGFLISIVLLSIAIFMSINQERTQRLARLSSDNTVEVASTDINKGVNQSSKMLALSNTEAENTVSENETLDTSENIINTENNISNNIEQENSIQESNGESAEVQKNEIEENNTNSDENVTEQEKKSTENQFIKPVEGEEISNFSMNSLIYSNTLQEWITHRGIDIKAEKGTEVKASKAGKVKLINNDPRYGVSVTIEHSEGFTTVYSCMLDTADIKEGDSVEQGQTIGHIGNSGVFEVSDGMHLHFELLKNGEFINPDIYVK